MVHPRVDHDVSAAANCVQAAVAGGHRAPGATRACERPSRSASRAPPGCRRPPGAGLAEDDLAAGVADGGVGEGAGELADRVGRRARRSRRRRRSAHPARRRRPRRGRGSCPTRSRSSTRSAPAARAWATVASRASVRGDDHLEALARPVEREGVCHLRADHRLLVVRRDDDRHGRRGCGRAGAVADAPGRAGARRTSTASSAG